MRRNGVKSSQLKSAARFKEVRLFSGFIQANTPLFVLHDQHGSLIAGVESTLVRVNAAEEIGERCGDAEQEALIL